MSAPDRTVPCYYDGFVLRLSALRLRAKKEMERDKRNALVAWATHRWGNSVPAKLAFCFPLNIFRECA